MNRVEWRPFRAVSAPWLWRSVAAAPVVLSGCLLFTGQGVESMRTRLIGVSARDLRSCVGVPFDTNEDGDTEYLRYRWLESENRDEFFDRDRRDEIRDPLLRGSRLPQRDPNLSREVLTGPSSDLPRGIGYCELVFEIQEGRVRNVEVEARQASGLNDDYRCIRMAEGCLPEE